VKNFHVILLMGFCVLVVRSAPFVFSRKLRLSDRTRSALELVPPAVIAVILASAIATNGAAAAGTGLHLRNPYLYGMFATLVASLLRSNFLSSIAIGSAVFTAARLAFIA